MDHRRRDGLLLVAAATLLWSLAGLFVRLIELPAWDLILWRSVFAGLASVAKAGLGIKGKVPKDLQCTNQATECR